MQFKFCLLDADYTLENDKAVVRLFGRTDKGESIIVLDDSFEPYFYILPAKTTPISEIEKAIKKLDAPDFTLEKVEKIKKMYLGKETELLKLYTKNPREVPIARERVAILDGVLKVLEADILFVRRYLIDRGLIPMSMISVTGEKTESKNLHAKHVVKAKSLKTTDDPTPSLNVMSFDIEAYGTAGIPQPDKNPIIMISTDTGKEHGIFTYKKSSKTPKYVKVLSNEKQIIEAFENYVKEQDVDILTAYNSDNFDFPYIRDRSKALDHEFKLGRTSGHIFYKSKGMFHAAEMRGIVHMDLYHYVTYILRGALGSVTKRTLANIANLFLPEGEEKKDIDWKKIDQYWKEGSKELNTLFEYSVNDAIITKKLADLFLPREYEIAKLVRVPLFDVSRMTYGQLVESYLLWNAYERGEVAPNRPSSETRADRASGGMYEGAYVKEPEKGMHENIALYDFRSLYPTVIISHNIDPSTLDCECCVGNDKNKTPDGDRWFCTKKNGLIPDVLNNILETRISVKEEMKKKDQESEEYKLLDNRQYALKILANSTYGYMGYRGARWYSKKCAAAVTAFGRMYIKMIEKVAEEIGLKVIYGDTDSLFVIAKEGTVKDTAEKFLKKVNDQLPGVMELEYEGFFTRGIFVTKKRYALIDEKGKTKIKGLEFVRKDWSPIAKDTQKRVIDSLLQEGNPEKAFEIVKEAINKIKNGEATKEDLVVYTELTRPLEKYESTAPHIELAKVLKQRGEDVHTGTSIGYIITKGADIISRRARLVDEVDLKNYDTNYYIGHQILPAVSRVMEALGYTEDDLMGKKQFTLDSFGE